LAAAIATHVAISAMPVETRVMPVKRAAIDSDMWERLSSQDLIIHTLRTRLRPLLTL
jgi:hypothetical protein